MPGASVHLTSPHRPARLYGLDGSVADGRGLDTKRLRELFIPPGTLLWREGPVAPPGWESGGSTAVAAPRKRSARLSGREDGSSRLVLVAVPLGQRTRAVAMKEGRKFLCTAALQEGKSQAVRNRQEREALHVTLTERLFRETAPRMSVCISGWQEAFPSSPERETRLFTLAGAE